MINTGSGHIEQGGAKLFWRASTPEQAIAATVMVHDQGEHSGSLDNIIAEFNEASIAVYAFDLRGHGASSGTRGHINHWQEHIDDLKSVVEFTQRLEIDLPLFLFGHGVGALIAASFSLRAPQLIQGLILSGVPLQPAAPGAALKQRLSSLVGMIWPEHQMSVNRPKQQTDDLLTHRLISVRAAAQVADAAGHLRFQMLSLNVPVLISHGVQDQVNHVQGARELHGLLTVKDKTLHLYENSSHDLAHGLDAVEYLADLCNWILPRASMLTFERDSFYKMGSSPQASKEEDKSVSSLEN